MAYEGLNILVISTRSSFFEETPTIELKKKYPRAMIRTLKSLFSLQNYLRTSAQEIDHIYIDIDTVEVLYPLTLMYELWARKQTFRIHLMSDDVERLMMTSIDSTHFVVLPIHREINLNY